MARRDIALPHFASPDHTLRLNPQEARLKQGDRIRHNVVIFTVRFHLAAVRKPVLGIVQVGHLFLRIGITQQIGKHLQRTLEPAAPFADTIRVKCRKRTFRRKHGLHRAYGLGRYPCKLFVCGGHKALDCLIRDFALVHIIAILVQHSELAAIVFAQRLILFPCPEVSRVQFQLAFREHNLDAFPHQIVLYTPQIGNHRFFSIEPEQTDKVERSNESFDE